MPDEPIAGPEQEGERPRPRVVDKRVSARAASGEAPAEPSPPASSPGAESPPEQAPPSEQPQAGGAAADAPASEPLGPGEVWTPEQEAEARAVAREIASRPGIEWVVNSAVSLANIAATKLDVGSPADAQIVIDALSGILKEVGGRLGNVEQPLRQTLAQLQMAYAERVTNLPQEPPGG